MIKKECWIDSSQGADSLYKSAFLQGMRPHLLNVSLMIKSSNLQPAQRHTYYLRKTQGHKRKETGTA